MIKNIIFDLGGVILTLDHQEAIRRFAALGLENAETKLDVYTQAGIFGALEEGRMTDEEFVQALSKMVGRELTYEECRTAWLGYRKEVPQRNIEILKRLREDGYRLLLLSNTNPFMISWAQADFDGMGGSIKDYFDGIYCSYELGVMKPDEAFFRRVLSKEKMLADECLFVDDGPRNVAAASELGITTFCPENGSDWTEKVMEFLK